MYQHKRLSVHPLIAPTAQVTECSLGHYVEIAEEANIAKSSVGDYSYVMERADIIYSQIGKFSNIASDVRINPGNHPVDWVSQHHFLYRLKQYGFGEQDNEAFFNWRELQQVTIGHDTWIGHRAIILPGVTVGNGAVIAAGAVVSKDVAPYSIVAGVPAKPLRTRFPKAIWQHLEETKWWDWDHETIKSRLNDFYDIRRFLQRYGE
ncbi:MAG: acetyltransferase [Desulfobulbaceae bacterium]|nr:MAG: acetyltransferase [Desulfobulbaceae bacterium]